MLLIAVSYGRRGRNLWTKLDTAINSSANHAWRCIQIQDSVALARNFTRPASENSTKEPNFLIPNSTTAATRNEMLAGSGVVGQARVGGWGLSRSGGRSKGQGGGRWDTELTGDIDQPSSRHATLPQPQISSISCRLSRCRYCCSNLLFFFQ